MQLDLMRLVTVAVASQHKTLHKDDATRFQCSKVVDCCEQANQSVMTS
jgi:hypothetical protein